MRRVVIDMQNALFADAVAEALRRFDLDFDPVMSDSPDKTADMCIFTEANILIMEVTAYKPWKLEERMKIRGEVKAQKATYANVIETANCTITVPIGGATPDFNPVSSDSSKYTVKLDYWYLNESPYPKLGSTDVFAAGKEYALRVIFTANEGYSFGDKTVFTINGEATFPYGIVGYRQIEFTAAATPTGVTVSGTATSFGSNTDNVILQLIAEGYSEADYEVFVKGNSAAYSIEGVAPGTYTMKVMKNNHVTREYTVTVGAENVTQDVKIYLLGDINTDGARNAADLTKLKKALLGTETVNSNEKVRYDIKTDDEINIIDLVRLKKIISD